jgi:hypothetical protein
MRKIYLEDHDSQYLTAMVGAWVNRLDKLHGRLVTGEIDEEDIDEVEESVTKRLLMLRNAVNFRLFELGYDTNFTNQLDMLWCPPKRDVKNEPDEDNEFEYPPSPKVKESEEPFDALMRVKREFMTAMERWTNMFELSEPERDELLDL